MNKEKLNSLVDYIKLVPSERSFLVLADRKYTFGDMFVMCEAFKKSHQQLLGKKCAVLSHDRESLALFLPLIDSICQCIFLQPSDIASSKNEFYKAADIEYIIELGQRKVIAVTEVLHTDDANSHSSVTSPDIGFLLATSGTSGIPKLASYKLSSLVATAKSDIDRGKDFIWGLSYDVNRFAGLQVYLQAIVSGSTLVIAPEANSMERLVKFFATNLVNCLSATPSFWRKLLMAPGHETLPLKRITLGGEISTESILSALSTKYPKAKIIHVYASTEAGVGFVVSDRKEGFPLEFIEKTEHLSCKLKINDNLLWIKSSHGSSDFLKGRVETDSEGYVNTGDLVRLEGNRVLFIGRESGSINVGGNKVMPERVESVLEEHALVSMARVFAKKNPVLGALVSAEVVLLPGANLTGKDLKLELTKFCRDRLESFEIPAFWKQVEKIKTNATGKKIRNKI